MSPANRTSTTNTHTKDEHVETYQTYVYYDMAWHDMTVTIHARFSINVNKVDTYW